MNKSSNPSAGSGLLVVLFSMCVIAALVAAIYSVTSSQVNIARREVSRAAATTYGDGVMESLFDQWRTAMISVSNATDRASGLTNAALSATLALPSSTTLPPPAGVSVLSWSVTAQTPMLASTTDAAGRPIPENGTNSSQRLRLYYLATVTIQYYVPANYRTVTLQRTFVRAGRNVFDNFFFGTQPKVEFHPGPPMYVSGTVYVGGDLFAAHDSLHFTQDVTYTGTMNLDFRPEDSRYGTETPSLTAASAPGVNWPTGNAPRYGTQQKLFDTQLSKLDPNFIDDPSSNDTNSDGNNNNDGFHELIEEQNTVGSTNPDPLQLDSTTSERLASNADYRVYVNASNAVSIYKGSSTTPLATSNAEYIAINGALTTNTALKDVREGDNVRVVTMDVGKITAAAAAGTIKDSANSGDGMLFYIKDTSAGTSVSTKVVDSSSGSSTSVTSTSRRGVKLVNGAKLPSVGLSIVTANIAYIQGDYNTGATSSVKPASNTATSYTPPTDNPSPVVTGYNRAPAAVVGDAVNVLSNAWNDANSLQSISSRAATSTTINTAIIAGNVPTTTASYSGGIENFVRFHEDWSNDYLTIYGALALLYDSEQATGLWNSADYSPPNRRWYYDTNLQDHNPPGFRLARVYERGPWVSR